MAQAQAIAGNAGAHAAPERRERVLDPPARVSEILFGVIMALTFTTTVDAASGGTEDLRQLLFAALGCNLAWGLVDAVMFLINALTARGRDLVIVRAVREAAAPGEAHRVLRQALPSALAPFLGSEDIERLRQRLSRTDDLPPPPRLTAEDWRGAVAVFLLVFLSTFPIVVPFLVIDRVGAALRASNLVAIAMLFACGFVIARYGGYRPWITGLSMVLIGVGLVVIATALGG
jgi:VIT1/CCC1 family predicted Fe2+/Mn2+ transporter